MSARALLLATVVALLASGCNCGPGGGASGGGSGASGGGAAASGGGSSSGSGGGSGSSGGGGTSKDGGSLIDPNAFWKNDPPPMWCGPDGGSTPPTPPGGTPECPDDKNRQGCPCPTVGMTAPCWPGLRANRGLGICRDGTTTCESQGELGQAWGECKGYVAPSPGATGAAACQCFSAGQWALANLSPCFISASGSQVTAAVSTYIDGGGKAQCPSSITSPPMPQPGKTFTTNTLKVDCAGHFKLCYELKAGQAATPKPSDCSLAKVCTEADYPTANAVTPFPDLPSWVSNDATCANAVATTGGYGEMSVIGQSVRCDTISDVDGGIKVFNRVQYCPLSCNQNPSGAGCSMCGQGGNGGF